MIVGDLAIIVIFFYTRSLEHVSIKQCRVSAGITMQRGESVYYALVIYVVCVFYCEVVSKKGKADRGTDIIPSTTSITGPPNPILAKIMTVRNIALLP